MAKFLLDTQIILWMTNEPEKISQSCKNALAEIDNEFYLSYLSIWELSIKLSIEKLSLTFSLEEFIESVIEKYNLKLLPISLEAIYKNQILPLIHKDPFDRIIIAQSITEQLPILSSDKIFDDYNIQRIW